MNRKVVHFYDQTLDEECPECGGTFHKIVESTDEYDQEGYQCEDCGYVIPP